MEDYIPANTGVVIQANSGTYTFEKTRVEVAPLKRNNLLHGTVENVPVSDIIGGSNSIIMTLGLGANGYIGFYRYTGSTLSAYKAFLVYDNATGAKGLTLSIDDENGNATGIKAVETEVTDHNDQWFTPQGLLLNGQPKTRGIYIHNGKKIVIKD